MRTMVRYGSKSKGYLHVYVSNADFSNTSYTLVLASGHVSRHTSKAVYRTRERYEPPVRVAEKITPVAEATHDLGYYVYEMGFFTSLSIEEFYRVWFEASEPRTTKLEMANGTQDEKDADAFTQADFDQYKLGHADLFRESAFAQYLSKKIVSPGTNTSEDRFNNTPR